jgi:hypothetical protein
MNNPAYTWIKSVNADNLIKKEKSFRRRKLLFMAPRPSFVAVGRRWPCLSCPASHDARKNCPLVQKRRFVMRRCGLWRPRGYKIRPINIKAKKQKFDKCRLIHPRRENTGRFNTKDELSQMDDGRRESPTNDKPARCPLVRGRALNC